MAAQTNRDSFFASTANVRRNRSCLLRALSIAALVFCPSTGFGIASAAETVSGVVTSDYGSVEAFANSPGISEAIAVNERGTLLGRREIVTETQSLRLVPYLRIQDQDTALATPASFTAIEVLSLSETDCVVGYATRPIGHPDGNQRAVIWENTTPHVLPLAKGYQAAAAHDIDGQANRVTGIQLGRNPPRLVPCLWERSAEGWQVLILESPTLFNPLLSSAHVVISQDGQTIAASLVRDPNPNARQYGLYLYTETDGWRSKRTLDHAVHLTDVNNHGTAVGRILVKGRRRAFAVIEGQGKLLPILDNHITSYAMSVNNANQIVGYSAEPRGQDGEIKSWLWQRDQIQELKFSGVDGASTAMAISDNGMIAGQLVRADGTCQSYRLKKQE